MQSLLTLGSMVAAYKGAEFVARGHHDFGGYDQQPEYIDPTLGSASQDILRASNFLRERR
jgi:hypothetical protein